MNILQKSGQVKQVMICISQIIDYDYDWLINQLDCFFGIKGHVVLVINPGPGCNSLLLQLIPRDILSACPHRQFHTLPGLLLSQAAL